MRTCNSSLAKTLLGQGEAQGAREAALRVLEKASGREEALVLLAYAGARLNEVDETRQLSTPCARKIRTARDITWRSASLLSRKKIRRLRKPIRNGVESRPEIGTGPYRPRQFLLEPQRSQSCRPVV